MSHHMIVFYESATGAAPVAEFLDAITDLKARAHCTQFLERLVNPGPPLDKKHAEHIRSKLWELKPQWRGVEYRFFYAQVGGRFVLLHAVIKKRQRLPASVFALAEDRLNDYLKRFGSDKGR